MATTTLPENRTTTSVTSLAAQLEAAKRAALRAEHDLLTAGEAMLAAAVSAVKFGQQERRSRVSAAGHVDHLLAQGRPRRPGHARASLQRAASALCRHAQPGAGTGRVRDRIRVLAQRDARHGADLAAGDGRVGQRHRRAGHAEAAPGGRQRLSLGGARLPARASAEARALFGRSTRAEDAAEMARATQTIADVLAALRATPPLLVVLAAEYGVRLRADADAAQDILDAAVAASR
jgi:hypothetical protein